MRFLLLAALLCLTALAAAQDAPRRKSGLWQMTMQGAEMPKPMTMQQCIDEKTDDMARQGGRSQERCAKSSVRRESGRVIVDSVCQIEGSTATTHGEFSGDMGSTYSGNVTTAYAPPLHGQSRTQLRLEARWLGPCQPGQKPGDIAIQGGPQIRGEDMQRMREGRMSADEARRMAEEMRRQYQDK